MEANLSSSQRRDVQINAYNPAWSPDSAKLAFHSDVRNGFHQIGIFDIHSAPGFLADR
jgi:Tol biopolymer transport system component